ncbi:helix-turn-helix transcriptional regulator [Actinoplanes sp. NPDC051411]|uniref:helix-turn-helix domain-containing protein n=1 Tax=Actinoplanes sp. NPDC051411 TaxID=3155522 RepID=UPI0034402998
MRRGREKAGLSLSDLASRMYSSKATVSRWLSGRALPTKEQVALWSKVCGTDPETLVDLWNRHASSAGPPPADQAPAEQETPLPPGDRRVLPSRRRWLLGGIAIVLVSLASAYAIGTTQGSGSNRSPAPAPCTPARSGPASAQPLPAEAGDLRFCPVVINDGTLPITGPFNLSGQVIGPVEERRRMVLLVHSDPRTCDALGNPAPNGKILIHDADIGSPDGSWAYVDHLGYDEAVTYARKFEYVLATPEALDAIRNDLDNYIAAGHDADNYAGITAMPAGAQIVARFDVPAGLYHGSPHPCPTGSGTR